MTKDNLEIGIIGSGSWGLALSIALCKTNNKITVFFNSSSKMQLVKNNNQSSYLPNIILPKKINLTDSHEDIVKCDYIFIVTPSQMVRQNLELLLSKNIKTKNFVICSKGIEKHTNKLMSDILLDIIPDSNPIIFSGPNFAHEVAKDLPTAFVLSSKNIVLAKELGGKICTKNFRPYFNNDIIGTQIGGSMKNIIAISCGIVIGKKLGENAKASILTRGLKEIISLGQSLGAKVKTFYGLSGLGDLDLSCNSMFSRNMNLGYKLAIESNHLEILKSKQLTEGVMSCDAICEIGKLKDIDLPICNAVQKILNGDSIDKTIHTLLTRPLQLEV